MTICQARWRAAALLTIGAPVLAAAVATPAAAQRDPDVAPGWIAGAVCYEVFVRSFYDSDGDGVGDLNGLIEKLDYINDGDPASVGDLGAGCIWLMPIAESPSYHGYDVADYYRVDREYGTNEDFRRLMEEAHRRGIRVLIDMVPNHMSSEHPFFQAALRDPASPYRDWFRWRETEPTERNEWGGTNWHRSPVREEYYYGFFWEGMPDLNYGNPAVLEEMKEVARFWIEEMGVDGFRVDAIIHLMEDGPEWRHVPGTHDVLREYGSYVRGLSPESFTIGEVWDSTAAMMAYYPDQLDAHFAFEVSDSILAAVRAGSARGLYAPALWLQSRLPQHRWAPFLRNHDQTRTATFLNGDLSRARVASTLLLTFPGVPFVYYGEELGMTGDKPDPRLRTPMHWRRAPGVGFTRGRAWTELQPDSLTANVEAQDQDERSLLNHHRRLIHLRRSVPALGTGELVPLQASSDAVAAYLRRDGSAAALVVVNLGDAALSGVTVASAPGALPAGAYAHRALIGGAPAGELIVDAEGRIHGYVPVPELGPHESHVLMLTAAADDPVR